MNIVGTERITLEMIRRHLYSSVICDALDALGYRKQAPQGPFLPMTGNEVLVGRCKTTLWTDMAYCDPRPYESELVAVDGCQPDDVMVCAAAGSARSGIWGELLSTAARNMGCVGALVDGCVRDTMKMKTMGFPCFAKGRRIYDSLNRQRVVDIDMPVEIDGVTMNPGDLIFIDIDGVVVVPREIEEVAILAAWRKVHDENITRDAIGKGMSAVDAYEKYGVL